MQKINNKKFFLSLIILLAAFSSAILIKNIAILKKETDLNDTTKLTKEIFAMDTIMSLTAYTSANDVLNLCEEKIIELENMLKSILDLNIPTATLVKEFQRLETLEDETDELKLEIQYKDQEIFEFMNSDRGKLLKENKELKKEMADLSECWLKKDKIRNKIKEVENGKENYIFERLTSEDIRRTIITNLNELLK